MAELYIEFRYEPTETLGITDWVKISGTAEELDEFERQIDDDPEEFFNELVGGRDEYEGLEFDDAYYVSRSQIPDYARPFEIR